MTFGDNPFIIFCSSLWITHKKSSFQNVGVVTFILQEKTVFCILFISNFTLTFIPYDNQQTTVIFDIQDLIPAYHVARVIDQVIESIEDNVFFEHYNGGGRSSYHPKIMTKSHFICIFSKILFVS